MYELKVDSMSCGHCVDRVTKSVQAIDRGATVQVDLDSKKVRIDSAAELTALTAAITQAGYPVTAATAV